MNTASDETTFFARLRQQAIRAAADRRIWAERLSGIDLEKLDSRAALGALPVLRKSDLVALQTASPPFGGLEGVSPGTLARLFVSPGPIFDLEGRGHDWWGAAGVLKAAGIVPADNVLNTFSYHFTPAGAMFESGALALGCAVIPAGPGNTADQLTAIGHYRPTAYVGTPDFLKILLDKAAEANVDSSSIRSAVVSGAALPPSLRSELEARGIKVTQAYGTADLGVVAFEDGGDGMVVNEGVLVEIVRPGTGEALPDGEVGEVVVTRLSPEYPLMRFATGDMSRILPADAGGRPRIAGWMGRADQATKVRGMFVRPEQIAALRKALGINGALRLVVTRDGEQDVMTLKVEHADPGLAEAAAARMTEITKLKGLVKIVPPNSLPSDGVVIADERPPQPKA